MSMKRALLYINLGTPRSSEPQDVASYLREFLMDPLVIDRPFFLRWVLVNCIIVPFRTKKTSEAYKKIWSSEGSPLMFSSVQLAHRLAQRLQSNYRVELAMRYGEPSIDAKIKKMLDEGCDDIRVLTAYPQYAQSSTETALEAVRLAVQKYRKKSVPIRLSTIKSYESHPGFIKAFATRIATEAKSFNPDFYLFSYHGLPQRHVHKISSQCKGEGDCSLQNSETNKYCYRRQCYITSELLVRELNLSSSQFLVGFQSRLSKGWIKPFSDEIYRSLPQKGVQRLLVVCPSFTADCLETLEEVGLRAREEFIKLGGEDLRLVPSLNYDIDWVDAIFDMLNNEQIWVKLDEP